MEPWKDSRCASREAPARAWRSGSRKALRAEDTGHVSKLYVKILFTFENFHSCFHSFLCIVWNLIILHSQSDVVLGHFGKNGSLRRPLFHYPPPGRWTLSISQR